MSNLNQAEMLEKGIEAVISKAEQIDQVCNDVNSLKDVVKSLTDVVKNNTELMTNTTTKLTDFTLEQAKKADELQQKALKKSHNKLSDVYANLSDASANVNERIVIKSNIQNEITQWMKEKILEKKETAHIHNDLATEIGNYVVGKWQTVFKSNEYSNDVNPTGGYTQIPERKPLIDITNRNDVGDLVSLIGVRTANTRTIEIPKYEFDFKGEANKIKERAENGEYVFTDVSSILSLQTLTLGQIDAGFRTTRDFANSNTDVLNRLISELTPTINYKMASTIISNTKNNFLKNQFPIVVRELEEKPANVIDTAAMATMTYRDLVYKISGAQNFRRKKFTNSVMLLSSRVINQMLFEYNNFTYPNTPFINTQTQTINLGYIGTVPYIPIEDFDLLKFDTASTPKEIGAILMDAEAYHIYAKPDATQFTTSYIHDVNVKNRQEYLLSMMMGCDLVDPYKVVVLTIKNV